MTGHRGPSILELVIDDINEEKIAAHGRVRLKFLRGVDGRGEGGVG